MKRVNSEIIEGWLDTIDCVIASKHVYHYCIGITVAPNRRRLTYKNFVPSWPHYLIIQIGLNQSTALKAEKQIFETLTKGEKASLRYRKYRHDTRDGRYYENTGGVNEKNPDYCLYIAWGTKKSYGLE